MIEKGVGNMTKTRCLITMTVMLFLAMFASGGYAQQNPALSILPSQLTPFFQTQSGQSNGQLVTIQPPSQAPDAAQRNNSQIRSNGAERLSEFEQYISGTVITINELQLETLKRLDGISFRYSVRGLPQNQFGVPVRIMNRPIRYETNSKLNLEATPKAGFIETPSMREGDMSERSYVVDAGFLTGTQEALSNAFKLLGIKSPLAISTDIKQYGYELFRQQAAGFDSAHRVPVGPDYVLGPGDELRISIWGSIDGQMSAVVDRDGDINLPKAGVLGVAGLTFSQAKELIRKQFSKSYTGFEMNVSMGALRTVTVYVVGNVERAGSYTLSSLSTIINALLEAGGPDKAGTMRNIQLKRGGKTIVSFDLYEFLLKGDKTKDIRLMPEDVVFVPPVGLLVGIAGSVKNPAIYELKDEKTIHQLLEMAGGLSTIAYRGRLQIERIIENNRQIVLEADLNNLKENDIVLYSGDMVRVFPVVPDKRIVQLAGAVQREGEYGFRTGMTVRELIEVAGGTKYYAYRKEAEVTRLHVTDEGPKNEKITINLENALKGDPKDNIKLEQNDYLFVRAVPQWELSQLVSVHGEVKFPGVYPIRKGEKLSSLIERAGGYSDKAYLRGAVFTRDRIKDAQQKNIEEITGRLERDLMSASSVQAATALSREEVEARKVENEQKKKFLDSLRTLKASGRLTIHIGHLRLLKGSDSDIDLEGGDSLYIPTMNSVVNVAGSVMTQGSFVYSNNLRAKDYVDLAGGTTRNADMDSAYVMKADGSALKVSRGLFQWSSARSRWEVASFGMPAKEVEPGDTVVVPEKVEHIAWLREIKDIAQIMFNLVVSAGVVKALY